MIAFASLALHGVSDPARMTHELQPERDGRVRSNPWFRAQTKRNRMQGNSETTSAPPGSLQQHGSAIKTLSKMELAQLNATLVLIRRGDIHLATRSLAENPDAGLALDLQAYIARHSPNDQAHRSAPGGDVSTKGNNE